MTEPLHIKYRPRTLQEFRGHDVLKESLRGVLEGESMPHVFAFYGPKGCGKTSLGRIIADHVGCESMDLIEIDPGLDRSVKRIRDLIGRASLKPLHGLVKVYIIDEVHLLLAPAQESLLKTLEEGPGHVYFVLCSTDPHKIKGTIRSRCAEYMVSRLGDGVVKGLLLDVCEAEGFPDDFPSDGVLDAVVDASDGIPREALVRLAMVKDFDDADRAREVLVGGFGEQSSEFFDLLNAVLNREPFKKVVACYKNLPERDPVRVRIGLVNAVRTKLVGDRRVDKELSNLMSVLDYLVKPINYDMAEPELLLDLYLVVSVEK